MLTFVFHLGLLCNFFFTDVGLISAMFFVVDAL